jgi:hypothetical protein
MWVRFLRFKENISERKGDAIWQGYPDNRKKF